MMITAYTEAAKIVAPKLMKMMPADDAQATEIEDSDRCYCCGGAPRQAGAPTCGHELCEGEFDSHTGQVFEEPPATAGADFEFDGAAWSVR